VIPPFPRTAEFDGDRLVAIGGSPVAGLAREHGTPLYVLDRAELVGRMAAWRDAFGPECSVAYASKALCVVGVLQLVAAAGLHLDVASAGELATAVRAGFPMSRVVFHGNNKSAGELEQAVALGVGRIAVDSFTELNRLSGFASAADRDVDVLLRVTPGISAGGHAFIRTGQDDSKFGFTLSAGLASEAVEQALGSPRLRLAGVHCHIGSQITSHDAHVEAAEVLVAFLAEVAASTGVTLAELNLGGGIGIVHEPGDEAPEDLGRYAAALRAAVAETSARHGIPAPRLAVEPGRAIAGPAGVTLYTVGTIKEIPGVRTYAAVDGGMSDNIRPALYGARYTFAAAGEPRPAGTATRPFAVAGKHCETGDVLGTDVLLPEDLAPGDLLAVAATGAYTHVMASNYNRLARPAMVLVGDGRADVIVRRETLDDVLARDLALPDS
jgi:diaminopimelate decarboxylase